MTKPAAPSGASIKKLGALLKRWRKATRDAALCAVGGQAGDNCGEITHELVYSLLLWESSTTEASASLSRVRSIATDLNELRVFAAEDLAEALGEDDPLAHERAARMRAVLGDVYSRFHGLNLDHLRGASASPGAAQVREAWALLASLDGCPPFAARRVALACLGAHAAPVDERLLTLLVKERLLSAQARLEDAAALVEACVPGGEMAQCACALQAWSDKEGAAPVRAAWEPTETAPDALQGQGVLSPQGAAHAGEAQSPPSPAASEGVRQSGPRGAKARVQRAADAGTDAGKGKAAARASARSGKGGKAGASRRGDADA